MGKGGTRAICSKIIQRFERGDPYGNRTRVSAVKGVFALESTARPAFHALFLPLSINGLAGRGDAQSEINRKAAP